MIDLWTAAADQIALRRRGHGGWNERHADYRASCDGSAYSVTARVLHWMTAALVLALVPLGFVIANEGGGAQQERLYDLHKSLGPLMVPSSLCGY